MEIKGFVDKPIVAFCFEGYGASKVKVIKSEIGYLFVFDSSSCRF